MDTDTIRGLYRSWFAESVGGEISQQCSSSFAVNLTLYEAMMRTVGGRTCLLLKRRKPVPRRRVGWSNRDPPYKKVEASCLDLEERDANRPFQTVHAAKIEYTSPSASIPSICLQSQLPGCVLQRTSVHLHHGVLILLNLPQKHQAQTVNISAPIVERSDDPKNKDNSGNGGAGAGAGSASKSAIQVSG
ncbi:uncharacterized protein CIMG_13504 [Coccidioides immitis RS]|uniref:Uncharacterized protein n=1 Tax=Coccidioides immitis (strain RS) TaxID=246410 RepID=A0A0D8JV65_COCIM|nr:uncharacterized protein CIMG_13504 [Coccidioides immitis RS]KJF61215.1 hypothetical protein CIMG_13504 [Coccidioides immitis RS]